MRWMLHFSLLTLTSLENTKSTKMFSKVSYLDFTSSIEKITLHAKVFFQEAGAPEQFKCLPSSSANPIVTQRECKLSNLERELRCLWVEKQLSQRWWPDRHTYAYEKWILVLSELCKRSGWCLTQTGWPENLGHSGSVCQLPCRQVTWYGEWVGWVRHCLAS